MHPSKSTSKSKSGAVWTGFSPKEPYTARLRSILVEYPDGSQILREILQNTDDSGATVQKFVLDMNSYPRDDLLHEDLRAYQGPALLSANNGTFTEDDFESLLSLSHSIKRKNFAQIGGNVTTISDI